MISIKSFTHTIRIAAAAILILSASMHGQATSADQHPRLQPLNPVQLQTWQALHPDGDTSRSLQVTGDAGGVAVPMGTSGSVQFSGFQNSPYISTAYSNIESTVVGDFNHDGKMDVVLFTLPANNTLQLLTGNGDGTFKAGPTQSIGNPISSGCRGIANGQAVDVNGDGYPDIVALCTPYSGVSYFLGQVVVFMNKGDGTFSAPALLTSGITWSYIGSEAAFQIYDVDGDGYPDIVVVGSGVDKSGAIATVKIDTFFGSASGSFTTRAMAESSMNVSGVNNSIVVQFGRPMKIVSVNGTPYVYLDFFGNLYIAPLGRDGTVNLAGATVMSLGSLFSTTAREVFIDLTDVNNDGINDLLLSDQDGFVYLALGNSATSFGAFNAINPASYSNRSGVFYPADVNGDGCTDLLVAGIGYLETYTGDCKGNFGVPKTTNLLGFSNVTGDNGDSYFPGVGPMVADWNGDGKLDVVSPDVVSGALVFFRGLGDGSFMGDSTLTIDASSKYATHTAIIVGALDLNGDGLTDVLVDTYQGILSGINQGNGKFTYTQTNTVPHLYNIASAHADFNRDGRDDIIQASYDSSYNLTFYVSYSNGDGTFNSVKLPTLQSTYINSLFAVGDINGDNWPDLVVGVGDQACIGGGTGVCGFVTYLNDGKGNLLPGQFIQTGTSIFNGFIYSMTLADIDGDGRDDLILSTTTNNIRNTNVVLYRSPADSDYSKVVPTTLLSSTAFTPFTYAIASGDMRNIGNIDLVLSTGVGVYQMLNDGYGNFKAPAQIDSQGYPSLLVNDINRDGIPDVIGVQGTLANRLGVNVLLGYGDATYAAPLSYYTFAQSQLAFPANLNGDGNLSLLVNAGGGSWGTVVLQSNASNTISLRSSSATTTPNGVVTLSAQVTSVVGGQGKPSGIVTFYEDGNEVGNASLNATALATFTTPAIAAGSHIFSAIYTGDTTFGSNLYSNSVTVATTAVVPAFSVTSPGSTLNLTQNSTVTAALTFAANSTFSGALALSCTGLPSNTACSFSNATPSLSAGGTATSTMTITSTSVTHAANSRGAFPLGTGGAVLACLLCLPALRRKRLASLFALFLAALSVSGMTGCSSGSTVITTGVTPGTYVVVVNAVPQNSTATPQTLSLAVTVK